MLVPAALFPLVPALTIAAVVAPPPAGPEDACPSARQVGEAMQARFPELIVSPEAASGGTRPDALRSVLDVAGDGTVVRFSLIDARGETQLRRTLPAPGRGRPVSECVALAETLAAIVERYLGGITYDAVDPVLPEAAVSAVAAAPEPATAPRSALLWAGLGWRMPRGAGGGAGEVEGRVGGQLELTRGHPRLSAALSLGIAPPVEADVPAGGTSRQIELWRFPIRLGALLAVQAGPGWVEPTAEAVGDVFVVSSTPGRTAPATRKAALGFGLQAAVGYRLKVAGPVYLRPRAAIGITLRGYDIGVEGTPDYLFSTPRAHASFGIDTGFLFR